MFSFFNWLFIHPKMYKNEAIITHELVHIQQRHTYDILFFEVFNKTNFDQDGIEDVNYSQIRSWIVSLVDEGVSNVSVNRKMASLKSFYKFLLKTKKFTKKHLKSI